AAKILSTKEVHDKIGGDDAWLDRMRAIRDEAFKKNPELEKEIRSDRFGQSCALEPKIDTHTDLKSSITPDNPITAEKRANYEERYQEIMKASEMRQAKEELLKQFEKQAKPEKATPKIEKDLEIGDF